MQGSTSTSLDHWPHLGGVPGSPGCKSWAWCVGVIHDSLPGSVPALGLIEWVLSCVKARDGCLATFRLLAVYRFSLARPLNYVEVQTYYAATWAKTVLHTRADHKRKELEQHTDTSLSTAPDHSFVQRAGRRCAVPRHSALLRIYGICDSSTYQRCRENPMHAFVTDLSSAWITARKQQKKKLLKQ